MVKLQIHLSFWNFLLCSLFFISTADFFSLFLCSTPDTAAIPVQPALTASVKALPSEICKPLPSLLLLLKSRRCDTSATAGLSVGTVLPSCRSSGTKLPNIDALLWKEVISLLPWVCQEAEEDSVALKEQNPPFESPFRKTPRSLKSHWWIQNLWSCPCCGELGYLNWYQYYKFHLDLY